MRRCRGRNLAADPVAAGREDLGPDKEDQVGVGREARAAAEHEPVARAVAEVRAEAAVDLVEEVAKAEVRAGREAEDLADLAVVDSEAVQAVLAAVGPVE